MSPSSKADSRATNRVASGLAEEDPLLDILPKFFRGLGDPTRLRILLLLLEGERNVSEIVRQLGVPQGRVSSHLACLRWCGYVQSRREGNQVFYTVADKRVRDILDLAQQMLEHNAQSILACPKIK